MFFLIFVLLEETQISPNPVIVRFHSSRKKVSIISKCTYATTKKIQPWTCTGKQLMTVYQSRQKLEVILIRLRYPTEMQKNHDVCRHTQSASYTLAHTHEFVAYRDIFIGWPNHLPLCCQIYKCNHQIHENDSQSTLILRTSIKDHKLALELVNQVTANKEGHLWEKSHTKEGVTAVVAKKMGSLQKHKMYKNAVSQRSRSSPKVVRSHAKARKTCSTTKMSSHHFCCNKNAKNSHRESQSGMA